MDPKGPNNHALYPLAALLLDGRPFSTIPHSIQCIMGIDLCPPEEGLPHSIGQPEH